MKKVSELTRVELDYWVAQALRMDPIMRRKGRHPDGSTVFVDHVLVDGLTNIFSPTMVWSDGGPIIDSERIAIAWGGNIDTEGNDWCAVVCDGIDLGGDIIPAHGWSNGQTPLIAAMRAFLSSKYGEEVPEVAS